MAEWIYNNKTVEGHSLYPLCHSTLNEVSNRDYPHSNYFNQEIECLDMDTYEKNVLRKDSPNPTVDAVIGISTYKDNQASDPRLLLVELRMDYQSAANLSKSVMEAKVIYTKGLLGGEKVINKECVFVFSKSVAPQARNWFCRQGRAGGEIRNGIVCSVDDFAMLVKSRTDFPYEPIHGEDEIRNSVLQFGKETERMNFLGQIRYWCKAAEGFRYKNLSECNHIIKVVLSIWNAFKKTGCDLTEDEQLELLILEEDFCYLNNSSTDVNA